jgi:hypothetical protein
MQAKGHPARDELIEFIQTVADELGIDPTEVQYNQLQRWMKENDDPWLSKNATVIKLLGGFTAIRDAEWPLLASDTAISSLKTREKAAHNRKELKLASREKYFLDKFEYIADRVFPNAIRPVGFAKKAAPTKGITREVNVLLSDLHFGSDLDPRYVPLKYGKTEEARRLAHVVKQVCQYKTDHRKETRLRVHLAGDIIQGSLHDPRDGDTLSAQVARAIWLLNQAIAHFAANFLEVVVHCTTGNHDRLTSRHHDRATYEKSDSLATIIYYALKVAAQNAKNVTFDIGRGAYTTYESFGAKCFGTHGDTVLNPGYPGNSINAKALENQINRINATLPNADEYKLFYVGHVHVGTIVHMGNGAVLITNGALIPSDQYSVSIGLFENNCGQWMWESVPGHVVGDSRFITVNGGTDKDSSLDTVIKPFTDF